MTILSYGHSTLSAEDFALYAKLAKVELILDVRSHPTSRWEQFRHENMKRWLPKAGLRYLWEPRLGGWTAKHISLADEMAKLGVDVRKYAGGKFPKQQIAQTIEGEGPSWTNRGLYDYSIYMSLPEFAEGVKHLLELANKEPVAMVCAEAAWWRCHRSMICDYLVWHGIDAVHVMPYHTKSRGAEVKLKTHSAVIGNRLERYRPEVLATWRDKVLWAKIWPLRREAVVE